MNFRSVLTVTLALFLILLPHAQAQVANHVVINEVELNPPGSDAGHEWIELYNPTSATVDLSDWRVQTTHGATVSVTLQQGTTIAPGGFYVVTYGGQWLDNQNEVITLFDKSGHGVDATPTLSDTQDDLYTWQRYPDGSSNWVFAPSTRDAINVAEIPTPILAAAAAMTGCALILRRRQRR